MAGTSYISSVLRATEALQVVGRHGAPMRLKTFCAVTRTKPSTAHNLLRTLSAGGFLVSTDNGYVLGPSLAELAMKARNRELEGIVERAIVDLAALHPTAIVTYTEPRAHALAVIMRHRPEDDGRVERPRGDTLSYFATISGLVWMACAGESEEKRLLNSSMYEDEGVPLWKERASLESTLKELRKHDGGSLPLEVKQSRRVAVPVRDEAGVLRGLLGISLPVDPGRPAAVPSEEALVGQLRDALQRARQAPCRRNGAATPNTGDETL